MRVAALYDIHGNLPALDAVLRDVRAASVDLIVVGGDVLPGPMPEQTMSRLLGLEIPTRFLYGNGDRVVLAHSRGEPIDEVPLRYRDKIEWTADRLSEASRGAIAKWPPTCSIEVDGVGHVLFCHATPGNDVDCFTRETPDERVARLFAGVREELVVCGHTHMQYDRTAGGLRIVNAGSVGAPFAPPAAAHWLLLGSGVEFRHTRYDLEQTAERMRATGFPLVEEVSIRYVLDPPSEAESMAMFAPADRR